MGIDAPGTYLIGYHVVFADGRESSGLTRFSVGTGATTPLDPAGTAATHADAPAADPVGRAQGGADPVSLLATAAGAVGSLVVVTVVLWRPVVRGSSAP